MSTPTEQFDAIIIGTGQSGGPLSAALGAAGWKIAIIERALVGGTCINYGCTPTKTMIASARVAHLVGRAQDYGVLTGNIEVDLAKVRQRKRQVVESFRSGSQSSIESAKNVELIMGEGSFSGPKTIRVQLNEGGLRELSARTIIVNTGARPRTLDLDGLSEVDALDSTSILELGTVPRHLIILGAGPIGMEFGQMFRRFGSQVTLIEHGDRLAAQEDADISQAFAQIFEDDGITILTNAEAKRIERQPDGTVRLTLDVDGKERTVTGDQILVAAGRTPNTDALHPDAAGIETNDHGYINVNDRLETAVAGIYAIGDVNGQPAFTHISYNDFRILKTNLLGDGGASRGGRMLPYTIFTDPQLGRIGLTESQACDQGFEVQVFKVPMASVARAIEVDETRGLMKAVVDSNTDQILGASILGLEGGEIAGAIQIAMLGNLPYTALRDGIFSHPTLLESLNTLFASPVE